MTQDTRAVRAGLENCDVTGAVVPPIHLSSTYAFRGFGDKRKYDYSRSGNPTRDLLADALADLEGGAGAVITGSGMGAITLVGHLLPIGARSSRRTIATAARSGCSPRWHKRGELDVEFVDFGNAAAVDAALSKPAALVWIETPSNPLLRITDIADIAKRAHAIGALVVADNTFLSPGWQQPIALGADHRGAFDHQVHQRPQRRGRRRGDRGKEGVAEQLAWWGNCLGPHRLGFRQLSHTARPAHLARAPARARPQCPGGRGIPAQTTAVKRVYYPGLASHPGHDIATRQQRASARS